MSLGEGGQGDLGDQQLGGHHHLLVRHLGLLPPGQPEPSITLELSTNHSSPGHQLHLHLRPLHVLGQPRQLQLRRVVLKSVRC